MEFVPMTTTLLTPKTEELKRRLKAVWSAGDYDTFSRFMAAGAEDFYQRLNIARGNSLLDVACGSGQLALIAARSGARVTGCDISGNWIERARLRAAEEGLCIRFDEADAECLPYASGQFDVVASLIGAMFAPRPELVASELTRVCRPGGLIAMANWTPTGFVGQMFRLIAKYIAPSGMPSPVLWGDEATVRERLSSGIAGLRLTRRMYLFEYPFPPERVVEFFRVTYGPMTSAFAALDELEQKELRGELIALWSAHNQSGANRTEVYGEYLEVLATRG
jgi:SAM-dependent methyltransferase